MSFCRIKENLKSIAEFYNLNYRLYWKVKKIMVSLAGTYQNGFVKFDKDYSSENPVKVIVTFLEDIPNNSENGILLEDFSFAKSQKNLKNFKGSLSDTVVEERRIDL